MTTIEILHRSYGGFTVGFEGRIASVGYPDTTGAGLAAAALAEDERLADLAFRNRRLHALATEVLRQEAEDACERRTITRAKRAAKAAIAHHARHGGAR